MLKKKQADDSITASLISNEHDSGWGDANEGDWQKLQWRDDDLE